MILCMNNKLLSKMQTITMNKFLPPVIDADKRGS